MKLKKYNIKDFGTALAKTSTSNNMQVESALIQIESVESRAGTAMTLDKYRKSLGVPQAIFFTALLTIGVLQIDAKASEMQGQNIYVPTAEHENLFIREGKTTLIKLDTLKGIRTKFERKLITAIVEAMNAKEARKA